MSEKLKPCPFCGGEAEIHHAGKGDIWLASCADTRCAGYREPSAWGYTTKRNAIIAWNTRTPEQAIAATLGGGRLTGDDVLNAVYNHGARWQAIADELNAALGDDGYKQAAAYWKRMYEELLTERIDDEYDYPEHDGRYECPDCGNVVYYDELYGGGWTIYVEDYQIPFNHCPKCGKAVKR